MQFHCHLVQPPAGPLYKAAVIQRRTETARLFVPVSTPSKLLNRFKSVLVRAATCRRIEKVGEDITEKICSRNIL
jgi:hypothetical protein